MARTTPADVREELDVTASEYPDDEADVDIRRANAIINDRIAPRIDDSALLSDIETLVAAHIASEQFADSIQDGRAVSSVTQGSAQVSYQDDSELTPGPGGFASTYWGQALAIDESGRLGVRTQPVTVSASDIDESGIK